MKEFKNGNEVIARLITAQDIHEGLNFFSNDFDFLQVGAWKYEKGHALKAHVHNIADRTINRTHEALYVIKGKLQARLYTLEGAQVCEFDIERGSILLLLNCGHGYTILEDDTTVLEVKNGPYLGAEVDRHRI